MSPSLFGHVDLAKFQAGASTMRNLFVNYRGGAYSRAGLAYCLYSRQTGRAFPPRLIEFEFSVLDGLALEFGNNYMRVFTDGAAVTEGPVAITGITAASPAVVSATGMGVTGASALNGSVIASYAPGEIITIAGGTPITVAQLQVLATTLLSVAPGAAGSGYVPADTVNLLGGTQTATPSVVVVTTKVSGATISAAGSGGTNGPATVTGTTGTGTKFQALVTIAGGIITAVQGITNGGSYTVNPTTLVNEPVTGGGLSGAALSVTMGVGSVNIVSGGGFLANAPGGNFSQASSSGAGTGATFIQGLFGILALGVSSAGNYTVFPSSPAAQAFSTGSGVGAMYLLTEGTVAPFANGDWVYLQGINGPTALNFQTFVVGDATTATFALFDVFGNPVDTTALPAYTGGGTASRVFTLATPWAEQDLPWLKVTQSADVMTICCVNQATGFEYQPQNLERFADDDWVLAPVIPAASIVPPASASGTASAAGAVDYQYEVTAISSLDGTESVASPIAGIYAAVDIASTAGTITVNWSAVPGAAGYYVYKTTPSYNGVPPVGAQFGFAGQAFGLSFADSNIVADFAQVPPTHQNPFANGQVLEVNASAPGTGYTQASGFINTATGSGAILTGVIVGGGVVAWIIQDNGGNYAATDTVTVVGDGAGATATLVIGPTSGNYPGVPTYFQERRVFGYSLNNPDTYDMSQPGAFGNFDTRSPPLASDAISGAPWGVQVDGIQFFVLTPAGLVTMTGSSAWLLVGQGSFGVNVQAFTPSSQVAIPQAFSGCSPTVPPIKINYDLLYCTWNSTYWFDLPYQLYALSEPIDITQYSAHLFAGFTSVQRAWCEQPNKLAWIVRSDGAMLSLTWLKAEQVLGWARHDTNGQFVSCCKTTEPPVDALYVATQRTLGGRASYIIERMDNRQWAQAENCFCVDCGFQTVLPTPNATLTADNATGAGIITGVAPGFVGGQNYGPATTVAVVDDDGQGPGTGAEVEAEYDPVTQAIVNIAVLAGGVGYVYPKFVIYDPSGQGSGFVGNPGLDNDTTFTASAPVFHMNDVGSIIRMGQGYATITAYVNSTNVRATIQIPISAVYQDSRGNPITVIPQPPGTWSLSKPTTTIPGLDVYAGAEVVGLADGNVLDPTLVSADGVLTIPNPATLVTVGLPFQAQLQSVYLDVGEPTVQGQRKKVAAATARLEASRQVKIGANQPDGSTQSPAVLATVWQDLVTLPDQGSQGQPRRDFFAPFVPLYSCDVRQTLLGGFAKPGQLALQQDFPLPLQVLAVIPEILGGDTPSQKAEPRQQQGRGR